MSNEVKWSYDFELAVAMSLNRIMKSFRLKMKQGGYDLSFENMTDLCVGIEGELTDFGSRCQQMVRDERKRQEWGDWK